jgi:hypothetical protein
MTLALAGEPESVQFGFPGRCCDVAVVTLRAFDGPVKTPQKDTVVWRIQRVSRSAALTFPTTVGETPDGYRETVPFDGEAMRRFARADVPMWFSSDVGETQSFRVSELSATGHVVQLHDGKRSVTKFIAMPDFRDAYLRKQAKEERGENRIRAVVQAAVVVAALGAGVVAIRRRSQSKRSSA